MSATPGNPPPHAGLHAIAMAECFKGVVALLLAGGLALAGPQWLRERVADALRYVHLDPQQGTVGRLLHAVDASTLHVAVAVALAYGGMRLLEAWGLWRAHAWASWFGCISAAVYLPFELHALFRHPGWLEVAVLLVNLLVVAVLAHDLRRRRRAGLDRAAAA